VGVKITRVLGIIAWAIAAATSIPATAHAYTETYDPANRTTTVTIGQEDVGQISPNPQNVIVRVEVGRTNEHNVQGCQDCRWTSDVDRIVLNVGVPNVNVVIIDGSAAIRDGNEFKLEVNASSKNRKSLSLTFTAGDNRWGGDALQVSTFGHSIDLNNDGDSDIAVDGSIGGGLNIVGSNLDDVIDLRRWDGFPDDDLPTATYSNWLYGEGGDDTIYGTKGRDRIRGGNGSDRLYGLGRRDYLTGGRGADRIDGGAGGDDLDGDEVTEKDHSRDVLIGGPGNDALGSYAGNDLLIGGPGSDWLGMLALSKGETVRMYGGPGNDWLEAQPLGTSKIYGGPGRDYLNARGVNWKHVRVDCGAGLDFTNARARTYRRCERLLRNIPPWLAPQP
jgi:hypothetical protein